MQDIFYSKLTWWLALLIFGGFQQYMVQFAIPAHEKSKAAKTEKELLTLPLFEQPSKLLEEQKIPNEPFQDKYIIWDLTEKKETAELQSREYAIRRPNEDKTLASIHISKLSKNYSWVQLGDNQLIDGQIEKDIHEVLETTALENFIRKTSEWPIEIIGIGLESSLAGDPDDKKRELSERRADNLTKAISAKVEKLYARQKVLFRTLSLGRAKTKHPNSSSKEIEQRTALAIAISIPVEDHYNFEVKKLITDIVLTTKNSKLDLSDYEYSKTARLRLSDPFEGYAADGILEWDVPD